MTIILFALVIGFAVTLLANVCTTVYLHRAGAHRALTLRAPVGHGFRLGGAAHSDRHVRHDLVVAKLVGRQRDLGRAAPELGAQLGKVLGGPVQANQFALSRVEFNGHQYGSRLRHGESPL